MKNKKSLKNKKCPVEIENAANYRVCTECRLPTCAHCGIYRQMIEKPSISYCALRRKTISEENIALFKTVGIIAVSVLASIINFSRLASFEEEELYLETILSALFYYLTGSNLTGAAALLFGGLFHWFLAFGTKSKKLTVFIMTCLQVKIESLRHYEWFIMVEHLIISCVVIHIMAVQKSHYVAVMLYSIPSAYCYYVYKFGICLEDLLLSSIIVFANHYCTTGKSQHCYLKDNITSLIIWTLLKKAREAIDYSGLGFKLF